MHRSWKQLRLHREMLGALQSLRTQCMLCTPSYLLLQKVCFYLYCSTGHLTSLPSDTFPACRRAQRTVVGVPPTLLPMHLTLLIRAKCNVRVLCLLQKGAVDKSS